MDDKGKHLKVAVDNKELHPGDNVTINNETYVCLEVGPAGNLKLRRKENYIVTNYRSDDRTVNLECENVEDRRMKSKITCGVDELLEAMTKHRGGKPILGENGLRDYVMKQIFDIRELRSMQGK